MKGLLILRWAVALILLMHSIPGIFNHGITDFGELYLDPLGFAPFGLAVAWAIKISHILAALSFLINRFVRPAAVITIFVLVLGIIMVHYPYGWYVVGPGNNGMEFNFLLIAALITIMFPTGIHFNKSRQ